MAQSFKSLKRTGKRLFIHLDCLRKFVIVDDSVKICFGTDIHPC